MASSAVGNNAYLKVKPSDLNTKAQQVQAKIQAMNDLLTLMTSSINTVNENWQSTSGEAFAKLAEKLIQEIKESLENLGFYVKDLNEAATKYEDLETKIQGSVSSLEDPSSIFNV